MSGWKSRYDYDSHTNEDHQSNMEKLAGRKLHVQDNYWTAAKILLPVSILITLYILKTSGDLFSGVRYFFNLLK